MTPSNDVISAGLEVYKSVAMGPRPQFVDQQPGATRIRMADGEFLLQMRPNAYSITSPDGDRLEYSYGEDDVTIKMMKSEKEVLAFYWHFRDPSAYLVEVTVNGTKAARNADHNSFGSIAGELLALYRTDLPASQAFRRYTAWFTLSDDFKFEVARRIAAYLPMGYFKAMMRARTVNMAACSIGCFMAALSLAAVPGTPDDWFWIGLCGSCAGMYYA